MWYNTSNNRWGRCFFISNPILTSSTKLWKEKLEALEVYFQSDVISINGPMDDSLLNILVDIVEQLKSNSKYDSNKLYIILTTNGGSASTVERMVNIFRYNYDEVNFIIPDYAYSAGTILCMSGDNIYMDYTSVLGPIDPQVQNKEGRFVPALGYLDKVNDLLDKAEKNTLSQAEFLILKDFDLAELRQYEQARDLTVDLLKKWLVKYKFKDWINHKNGSLVKEDEKVNRAEEIAKKLGDYSKWKSHARPLNIENLLDIGLKIKDYSNSEEKELIREYYNVSIDYMSLRNFQAVIHYRFF